MDAKDAMKLTFTYVCAHCGCFAEVSFWDVEAFDSGTTLTCDKCGEKTIVLLVKPGVYVDLVAYKARRLQYEARRLRAAMRATVKGGKL